MFFDYLFRDNCVFVKFLQLSFREPRIYRAINFRYGRYERLGDPDLGPLLIVLEPDIVPMFSAAG